MEFNCVKATEPPTTRRQFTFTTKSPEVTGTHLIDLRRMKRLSRSWTHTVVLNFGPLDWKFSALTTNLYSIKLSIHSLTKFKT